MTLLLNHSPCRLREFDDLPWPRAMPGSNCRFSTDEKKGNPLRDMRACGEPAPKPPVMMVEPMVVAHYPCSARDHRVAVVKSGIVQN